MKIWTALFVCLLTVAAARGQETEPLVTTSFLFEPPGNQIGIESGEEIPFPNTSVGGSVTATFLIANRDVAAAVSVDAVAIAGDGFALSGLPLIPAQLGPGQELRFFIRFTPASASNQSGSLLLRIDDAERSYGLAGRGLQAEFSYETEIAGEVVAIQPGGVLQFPPAPAVSGSVFATFRIKNTGEGQGRIERITVTGSAFRISAAPQLPLTLTQDQTATLTVSFVPPSIGEFSEQLQINDARFSLAGAGQGSKLTLAIIDGDTVIPADQNGRLNLPGIVITGERLFTVRISNDGNETATIQSIDLSGPGFSVLRLPVFPARIEPQTWVEFDAAFAPEAVGTASGVLRIDDASVLVLGNGMAPPQIPEVRFTNLADTVEPQDQPSVGMELASPYPVDLEGTLSVSFTSDSFVQDPSVLFSSGTKEIGVRIPAGETQAAVGPGLSEIRFQTGTIAGVITLQARFRVTHIDVTGNNPPSKFVRLLGSEPRITDLEIVQLNTNAIELIITGFATPRAVTKLDFEFAARPGIDLDTKSLSANVERAFQDWYGNQGSHAFGSQFSASVRFDLSAGASALDSIAVTASNAVGPSESKTVEFR